MQCNQVTKNAINIPFCAVGPLGEGKSSARLRGIPSLGAAISVGVVPGGGGEAQEVLVSMKLAAPSSTSLETSTECSCSNFILISFSSRSFC